MLDRLAVVIELILDAFRRADAELVLHAWDTFGGLFGYSAHVVGVLWNALRGASAEVVLFGWRALGSTEGIDITWDALWRACAVGVHL